MKNYNPDVLTYKMPFDEIHYKLQDVVDTDKTMLILRPKDPAQFGILLALPYALPMPGTTPAYGIGSYIGIRLEDQGAWDTLIENGTLELFEPIVYTIPVFRLYAMASAVFQMNLSDTEQYAERIAETVLMPQSTELFDTCVRENELYMEHPRKDAALVSILGVRFHFMQK